MKNLQKIFSKFDFLGLSDSIMLGMFQIIKFKNFFLLKDYLKFLSLFSSILRKVSAGYDIIISVIRK